MKVFVKTNLTVLLVLLSVAYSYGQSSFEAPLSDNAPTDKPHDIIGGEQLATYEALVAPYVKKAQKTLPKAKRKYLKGLKDGEGFFLTVRIYDDAGRFEQIFVKVKGWQNKSIHGTIANNLNVVKGFSFGQLIEFPESVILDWLITKSDGSEEGNYVGKYLDTLR